MIALMTFPQPWPIQGFIEAALSPLPQFQGHCHVATRPVGRWGWKAQRIG
jgi:hypothetical protein